MSDIKYIKNINEIIDTKDFNTDYVISCSGFPLEHDIMLGLLDVELHNAKVLNCLYLEYNKLDLSARQILNLSNNINVNILIKDVDDKQMQELLINYIDFDMRKCVYPAKLVVVLTLLALYRRIYYNDMSINDMDEFVAKNFDYVVFSYISDKYSIEYISKWCKFLLTHIVNEKLDLITNFREYCYSLISIGCFYQRIDKDEGKKLDHSQHLQKTNELKSGLYVPICWIMNHEGYNPYQSEYYHQDKLYNFVSPTSIGDVLIALEPISFYSKLVENYLASKKVEIFVEDLSLLTEEDIVKYVINGNSIVADKVICKFNLFPLEVRSSNAVSE